MSTHKISFEEYLEQHPYEETRSFTREDWESSMWEHWNELYNNELYNSPDEANSTPTTNQNTHISIPIEVIQNILRYCEEQQIYDKLGRYGDFYYKLKRVIPNNNIPEVDDEWMVVIDAFRNTDEYRKSKGMLLFPKFFQWLSTNYKTPDRKTNI